MEARVISVNISEKKGTVKKNIVQGNVIENFGFENDAHSQADSIRQISLLAVESIKKVDENLELPFGSFAENITTEGICLHKLPLGTILKIGDTIHKVSKIGKECHQGCEIAKKIGTCIMPKEGIFTMAIKGGTIKVGDKIEIIEYGI